MKKNALILIILAIFLVSCSTPSNQAKKNKLRKGEYSQYGNWLFSNSKDGCYIYSFPVGSYGNYTERDLNYIMVNYNKEKKTNELVVVGGMQYTENSTARIQIENMSYLLLTVKDEAWATDDEAIISKMLNNNNSDVLFFSELKGEKPIQSLDKYSLLGFHEAYNVLQVLCASS